MASISIGITSTYDINHHHHTDTEIRVLVFRRPHNIGDSRNSKFTVNVRSRRYWPVAPTHEHTYLIQHPTGRGIPFHRWLCVRDFPYCNSLDRARVLALGRGRS
jgi:hypothetical protein